MRRSKLEIYIDILNVLALKGQLKLTHIMYKSNVNCKVLKEQLEFLIKNGLVEEKILRKERVVYGITPKGSQVLKYFREIEQVFPMKEEVRHHPLLY
jgi:predicted transcriptional regulator